MGVLKTEEVASLYRRYAGMVYQIGRASCRERVCLYV